MTHQAPRSDLTSVQYLRAIAALMVVAYHVSVQTERGGFGAYKPVWLASGVDIFFVISGFIMWITTTDRDVSAVDFYKKRITRIVPLYWILTTIMLAGLIIYPKMFNTAKFDFIHTIASYLFVPTNHPVLDYRAPLLVQGWTLNYEMFFYLIFGSLLWIRGLIFRLFMLLLVFSTLVVFGFFLAKNSIMGFYTQPIILEFVAGATLAEAYRRGVRLPSGIACLTLAAGFLALPALTALWPAGPSAIRWGIPALLIVAGALSLERKVPSVAPLVLLGDASYSIYLSHAIVLSALGGVWAKLGLFGTPFMVSAFLVLAMASATIFGLLVFYGLERPVTKLLRGATRHSVPVALTHH